MQHQTDRATLDATVRAHYPQVKRFVRNKIPEPDCYDLANEAMRVFLSRDPSTIVKPKSYLWGIVRMLVFKYAHGKRPMIAFDSELHSIAEFRTSISTVTVRRNRLLTALATLPMDHQTAFELHYAEELTLAEVAEVLEKSVAQTKRYIASAKQKLAAELGLPPESFSNLETQQIVNAYRES